MDTSKNVTRTTLFLFCGFTLLVGLLGGFLAGIAATKAGSDFLESMTQVEIPADVDNPASIAREQFHLKHPGNWSVGLEEEDYDPDANFTINSPGDAFVMFMLGPGEFELEDTIQGHVEAYRRLMPDLTVENAGDYGSFSCVSAKMHGSMFGIPHTVSVYAIQHNEMTVIVVEQFADEDKAKVQPGFELIRDSFRLEPQG